MDRRRVLAAVVALLTGAAIFVFVVRPLRGPSEDTWEAQIAQDAIPLTQLLRFDLAIEDTAPVEAAWAKRRALYDEEHLLELRRRLLAFVDFQVGEYGDAREIYMTGRLPERPTNAALLEHAKLRGAFEIEADEMIRQYAQKVREEAYKASPKVAGEDPDLPKYDEIYRRVVEEWLPKARGTVDRLTTVPR